MWTISILKISRESTSKRIQTGSTRIQKLAVISSTMTCVRDWLNWSNWGKNWMNSWVFLQNLHLKIKESHPRSSSPRMRRKAVLTGDLETLERLTTERAWPNPQGKACKVSKKPTKFKSHKIRRKLISESSSSYSRCNCNKSWIKSKATSSSTSNKSKNSEAWFKTSKLK